MSDMLNEESKEQNSVYSMLPFKKKDLPTPMYMLLYKWTLEEYSSIGSCFWEGN